MYDLLQQQIDKNDNNFNPRTHEGYDHDFFTNEKLPFNSFNPCTREGYDVPLLVESNPGQDFNPRIHEGYDLAFPSTPAAKYTLIPVPMKGTICLLLV